MALGLAARGDRSQVRPARPIIRPAVHAPGRGGAPVGAPIRTPLPRRRVPVWAGSLRRSQHLILSAAQHLGRIRPVFQNFVEDHGRDGVACLWEQRAGVLRGHVA